MSLKTHSNASCQSSRGSASKGRMQLTSYLWKKIGMLWKNYGKAMEFLFWGSVRTLFLTPLANHRNRDSLYQTLDRTARFRIRRRRTVANQLSKDQQCLPVPVTSCGFFSFVTCGYFLIKGKKKRDACGLYCCLGDQQVHCK